MEEYSVVDPPLTKNQKQTLQEFKKKVEESDNVAGEYPDEELLRFLVARKYDVKNALEMLNNHEKWRTQFGTFEEIEPQVKKTRFFRTNVLTASTNRDKFGRPVVYWTSRNHNSRLRGDLDDLEPYFLHLFECCIANMGEGASQFMVLVDLSGFQMRNTDLSFVNRLANVAQSLIPERLGTVFVLHSPWFFSALWKVIRGWLDERTSKKVHFLGKDYKEILNQFLDDDQLPVSLGGTMPNIESEFDIWHPPADDDDEDGQDEIPAPEEPELDEKDEKAISEKLEKIETEQRNQVEAELKSDGKKKKKKKKSKSKGKPENLLAPELPVAEEPEQEPEKVREKKKAKDKQKKKKKEKVVDEGGEWTEVKSKKK